MRLVRWFATGIKENLSVPYATVWSSNLRWLQVPATTETDTPAAASAAGVLVFAPLADKLRSDKGEEARKLWPRKGRHELEAIAAKDHKLGRTV